MTEPKVVRTVVVNNPQGLHARPADMLVKVAVQYESKVEIIKEGERANCRSILELLMLAATEGTPLQIEATGHDAEAAMNALVELFQHNFGENGTTE